MLRHCLSKEEDEDEEEEEEEEEIALYVEGYTCKIHYGGKRRKRRR